MIEFVTALKKFDKQGEKTGWTYIEIPADIAQAIKPGFKKSFRVKGKLDSHRIEGVALLPMGGGTFIMPVNGDMRKKIGKRHGAMLTVKLHADEKPFQFNKDFVACLADEPRAEAFFKTLPKAHQHYFSKWIDSAKTEPTRANRIAKAVNALAKKWGYGEMLRAMKADKDQLTGG